jgi:hypothetical protein
MENKQAEQKWQNFLDWIAKRSNGFVFRGVSDKKHLLIPSVGRFENYSFQNEFNLFEQFKMRAKMHISASNDFEWLSIAQHHNLPTRLLDWTENPLIACFFAVISNKGKDGRVYFTKIDGHKIVSIDNTDPFSESHICFYFPNIITSRISLQKGLFTLHPKPNVPVVIVPPTRHNSYALVEMNDVYDYTEDFDINISYYMHPKDEKESDFEYQEKFYDLYLDELVFNIEAQYKDYFDSKIRQFGVDETIFGDVDSIAKKLKNDLNRNHLHPIFYREDVQANIDQITKDLKRRPRDHFREYIKDKKYCTIRSNIIITSYEKMTDSKYNFKGVIEIHPNYFDIDEGSWTVTPEQSMKIKKFHIILSKVLMKYTSILKKLERIEIKNIAVKLFHIQDTFLFYFKIDNYKKEFYQSNALFPKTDEKYVSSENWNEIELYYKLYKKYEEILNNNKKEKQKIENFDFTDIEFDKYIADSTFLKNFQPLSAIYNQVKNN